jgi:hypothetical protein
MKVIAQRIWNEPAVCIGVLTTLILVGINLIGDNEWGIDNIIAVVAPLASALGIRQAVYSPATVDELTKPDGTTYQPKVKV